ncbi:hypothetical protein AB7M17_002753 [Bradyrhizobium sp. USDA 377]
MGVVVPVRMVVRMTVGMAMSMVVMMGVGRGGNHAGTLYYNITPVHGSRRHPGAMRSIEPGISRFRVRLFEPPRNDAPNVHVPAQGFPITMAMAAATNGNGTETAQRNQTKRAGMNGISHKITRWKANNAQATT